MMKCDWKKCKLGEVVNVKGGKRLPAGHVLVQNVTNHPYLRVRDLTQRFPLKDNFEYITEDTFSHISRYIVKENDVVLSIVGSIGLVALINKNLNNISLTENAVRLFSTQVYPLFLYYYLLSPFGQAEIAKNTVGAVQAKLPIYGIQNINISLPSMEEQKRIAQILGALDDKIELLQKQNKTLEDMAKAIFKSWFVDFDVVHAKQKGLPKADIMREYHLTDELYDLFPSDFENSSLGLIPLGWQVKPLSDIATLTMGQSPAGTTYNESGEGLPFYQGRTDFEFRFPKKRVYCSAPTRIAEKGDVLISVRAPVGDLNMANERCCIGRGVASIRPNTLNNSFLYYAMLNIQKKFDVFNTEGTVFGSINRKDLSSLAILTPSEDVLQEFNAIVISFDLKIEENLKQIQTLTELRDTLLPPLISGKIRV